MSSTTYNATTPSTPTPAVSKIKRRPLPGNAQVPSSVSGSIAPSVTGSIARKPVRKSLCADTDQASARMSSSGSFFDQASSAEDSPPVISKSGASLMLPTPQTNAVPGQAFYGPTPPQTDAPNSSPIDAPSSFNGSAPLPDFNPPNARPYMAINPNKVVGPIDPWTEAIQPRNILVPKLPNERPVGGGIALPRIGCAWPSLNNPDERNWATEAELRANPKVLRKCDPFEFSMPVRTPEILYRDVLGIEMPGVAGTKPCDQQVEHDVLCWNFADWPEYDSSTFAAHGITYEDYYRLASGAIEILQRAPFEVDEFYLKQMAGWGVATAGIAPAVSFMAMREGGFKKAHLKGHKGTWRDLKTFFYEASENLRARGVPVVIKFKNPPNRNFVYWNGFNVVMRHQPLHIPMRRMNKASWYMNE